MLLEFSAGIFNLVLGAALDRWSKTWFKKIYQKALPKKHCQTVSRLGQSFIRRVGFKKALKKGESVLKHHTQPYLTKNQKTKQKTPLSLFPSLSTKKSKKKKTKQKKTKKTKQKTKQKQNKKTKKNKPLNPKLTPLNPKLTPLNPKLTPLNPKLTPPKP